MSDYEDMPILCLYIDMCVKYWEIPHLIRLITIALVLCLGGMSVGIDNVSSVYRGKEAAAIQLTFFQKKRFR
jgi:hypothetical protein